MLVFHVEVAFTGGMPMSAASMASMDSPHTGQSFSTSIVQENYMALQFQAGARTTRLMPLGGIGLQKVRDAQRSRTHNDEK